MNQNLPEKSQDRDVQQGASGHKVINGSNLHDVDLSYGGNHVIFGGKGNDFYVYQLGEGYIRIEDEAGTDTVILKQIWRNEVTLKLRDDGFHIVLHNGEPIVEMRGIEYIQTEDGCWSVERQWGL
jgi:hypothetical protein